MKEKIVKFNWEDDRVTYLWPNIPLVIGGDKPVGEVIELFTQGHSDADITTELESRYPSAPVNIGKFVLGITGKIRRALNHQISRESTSQKQAHNLAMATLNLTNACNLACTHCYAYKSQCHIRTLNPKEVSNIIQQLGSVILRPPKLLIISGGEPTLAPDLIQVAVEAAQKNGLTPRLNTNGHGIEARLAEFLARNDVLTQVSLDGVDAKTHSILRGDENSYHEATDAIKTLVAHGCRTRISCTTHAANAEQIPDLIDLSEELGASEFITSNLTLLGRASKNALESVPFATEFELIYQKVKDSKSYQMMTRSTLFAETVSAIRQGVKFSYCGTGSCTCCIDADGSIYPCINMQLETFKAGNVISEGLSSVWENSEILLRLRELDIDDMNPRCSSCIFRYFCGGYCRGETLEAVGNLAAPYARCKDWKRGLRAVMNYLSETPNIFDFNGNSGLGFLHRQ